MGGCNMKKKRFLLFMIVCLVLSMFPAAFAEGTPEERYHTELNAFRFIYNIPTAFEAESFATYSKAAKALRNMDCSSLNEKDLAKLEKIEDARAALVQIASPEEVIWEIWGQNMPVATDKANLVFDDKSFDNEDFRPFLVPYLVNDQNEAIPSAPTMAKVTMWRNASGIWATTAMCFSGVLRHMQKRTSGWICSVQYVTFAARHRNLIWVVWTVWLEWAFLAAAAQCLVQYSTATVTCSPRYLTRIMCLMRWMPIIAIWMQCVPSMVLMSKCPQSIMEWKPKTRICRRCSWPLVNWIIPAQERIALSWYSPFLTKPR